MKYLIILLLVSCSSTVVVKKVDTNQIKQNTEQIKQRASNTQKKIESIKKQNISKKCIDKKVFNYLITDCKNEIDTLKNDIDSISNKYIQTSEEYNIAIETFEKTKQKAIKYQKLFIYLLCFNIFLLFLFLGYIALKIYLRK